MLLLELMLLALLLELALLLIALMIVLLLELALLLKLALLVTSSRCYSHCAAARIKLFSLISPARAGREIEGVSVPSVESARVHR